MPSTLTDRLYGASSGVAVKAPVVAVTNGVNLPLVGLTAVGGYIPVEGDRILVKDQANPIQNGIYNASASAWQRAGDFDGAYDVVQGTLVIANLNNGQALIFQLTTPNPVKIGSSNLTFSAFWQPPNVTYPQTPAERAVGVIPTLTAYLPGDLRRYGAVGDGATDDSVAWQSAITAALAIIPAGYSFRIVTPATKIGQVAIRGEGKTSKLLCDTTVLTVTNGTGSLVDNFWMENITAPWIITRNPANWPSNILGTLQQSNTVLGYQPTVNDVDLWSTLTAPQQNQNVGPVIKFTGIAEDIKVSRIYGRFVCITIQDATDSCIEDCDIRGGKAGFGALAFDNMTNGLQRGSGNRAFNNRVKYASFCGVVFLANDDATARGNLIYRVGESGIKTYQATGGQFTGSVGGLTAGTLNTAIANGIYTGIFDDLEIRTVTVSGGTAASWSGALAAGVVATVSLYQTTLNPQCFRAQIVANHCYQNYYEGIDSLSCFPTFDAAQTYHLVEGNHCYGGGGAGISADGRGNSIQSNHCYHNQRWGIWGGAISLSRISGNFCIDNNLDRSNTQADIVATGVAAQNKISDNYVWSNAGTGGGLVGIFAPGKNYVRGNDVVGTGVFVGNPGQVVSVYENNIDANVGALTDQSFTLWIQNNGGILQHTFISDPGGAVLSNFLSRINAAFASFTTTPTGADATTPMAAGGKIGSGSANFFWCDTAPQVAVNAQMATSIGANSTGTAVNVQPQLSTLNINGVNQIRLAFGFTNATTGAAFGLTTVNIPAGTFLKVVFYGKLA